MTKARGFEPNYAVPPGETIIECFAEKLGLENLAFTDLLIGRFRIDERLAEALHKEIGPSAQFWLNLEKNYRATLKRLEAANP